MHGLYLLWWVGEKQMPAALVATTLAAGDLAIAVLEVPTGWFADRFGYRVSLIIGSLVQVAGMLCCWLASGVPGLILAAILVALGDVFRSGADQALLYRTCVALDREHTFQAIEAKARAVQLGALVALVLAGGLIVRTWGFAAGWAAETVLCALGALIACAMVEPPASDAGDERPLRDGRGLLPVKLAVLILPAALLGAAASAASFIAQTGGRGGPDTMTLLVAAITLAEAFGAAFAARLPAGGLSVQGILTAAGMTIAVTASMIPSLLFIGAVVLAFLMGLAGPLRAAAIQRAANDTARARAASAASALDMAFAMILVPVAVWWLAS